MMVLQFSVFVRESCVSMCFVVMGMVAGCDVGWGIL